MGRERVGEERIHESWVCVCIYKDACSLNPGAECEENSNTSLLAARPSAAVAHAPGVLKWRKERERGQPYVCATCTRTHTNNNDQFGYVHRSHVYIVRSGEPAGNTAEE
eukprot:scpid65778/ scgid10525/ 